MNDNAPSSKTKPEPILEYSNRPESMKLVVAQQLDGISVTRPPMNPVTTWTGAIFGMIAGVVLSIALATNVFHNLMPQILIAAAAFAVCTLLCLQVRVLIREPKVLSVTTEGLSLERPAFLEGLT